MEYRHEYKYLVSEMDLALIKHRICCLMKQDKNQEAAYYTISSLYFDDNSDTCLQENLDGRDMRAKYRVRIYNHSMDMIKLEKKSKIHGMTQKIVTSITQDECRQLMNGNIPFIQDDFSEVKKRLLVEMKALGLMPKCIVEYNRTAYIEKIGNVRVTFDQNIRGTSKVKNFMEQKIYATPVLPTGMHVLEVKYDEILLSYLHDAIDIGNLQRTAFSKYSYARKVD